MKFEKAVQMVMDECRAMNDPENKYWIVGKETGELVFMLARALRARTILEVGTSIGYSGLFFAQALKFNVRDLLQLQAGQNLSTLMTDSDSEISTPNFLSNPCTLFTIESHEGRFEIAKAHFEKAGLSDFVHQIAGHAPECIPFENPITGEKFEPDIVFLDATKGQYMDCFNAVMPLLKSGGLVLADNMYSHAEKLVDFTNAILGDDRFDSMIIPIGTGVLFARKK